MTDNPYIFDATADSFASAVVERSHDVLVLVDFWAEWCGPCRSLAPILEQLIDEFQGQVMLAKVDTDAQSTLAGEHGIRSLPTVRLYKNGQVVDEFMGVRPAPQIRAMLEPHLPRASDGNFSEAQRLIDAGQPDAALAVLEQAYAADAGNARVLRAVCELSLQLGHVERTRGLMDTLDSNTRDEDWAKAVAARLLFAEIVKDAPPPADLEAKVSADPADHQARYELSAWSVLSGDLEAAMDGFLEVMRGSRSFGDDAARKAMLALFEVLGSSHPLVAQYRQKLASALY